MFENEPQTALAEYGLQVEAEDVPANVTLPTREAMQSSFIDVEDPSASSRPPSIRWAGFFGS